MAKSNPPVWLGYDDELIHEKYKGTVDFTTNKIGGKPDFPVNYSVESPICKNCRIPQLLVVQVYAPIEELKSHRILYLFACINPNCWNNNDSWTCLRVQTTDNLSQLATGSDLTKVKSSATDWCQEADDWNDDNANFNEQNGNVINAERVSDEEDESISFEESVRSGIGKMTVDDQNANTGYGEAQGGAVGKLASPAASAEIEGNEGEVITIDTPTIPQHNIAALLQEHAPLPQDLLQNEASKLTIQFAPHFMNVWEESNNTSNSADHHVRDLLEEYQQNSEEGLNFLQPGFEIGEKGSENLEKYEKANPAHGDKLFHYFLSRIQLNPGQLLRYSRDDSSTLLISPLQEAPTKCQSCQGEVIFEFQVLPTIIPKLRLLTDEKHVSRVEFGNVLVYTCKKSCWSTDSVSKLETVVVQKEMY